MEVLLSLSCIWHSIFGFIFVSFKIVKVLLFIDFEFVLIILNYLFCFSTLEEARRIGVAMSVCPFVRLSVRPYVRF